MPHSTSTCTDMTATKPRVLSTDPSGISSTQPMSHRITIEPRPSWGRFKEREARLAEIDHSDLQIPPQFPRRVVSQSVWTPESLDLDESTFTLHAVDIQELESALSNFQKQGHNLNDLSPSTFPLPSLGPRFRATSADIHFGRGIAIIQGLNPDKYSLKENVVLYGGISSYIGDKRGSQSGELDVLTHLKAAQDLSDARPSLTQDSLPFHNDPGEILGLYVVEPAVSGGQTRFASAGHVYNEIARTKPHLISVLAKDDWPSWTARKPIMRQDWPLLYPGEGGKPFFGYTRYALTGSLSCPRPDILPPLTDLQADALDTIEFIAAENSVALPQHKGNIYYLSNRVHFHARTAYSENSSGRDRHLIRLILMDSEYGHTLPEKLNSRWGHFFEFPREQGKWVLEKDHAESFASSSKFDRLYTDESGTHSTA